LARAQRGSGLHILLSVFHRRIIVTISYILTENNLNGAPDATYRAMVQTNGSIDQDGVIDRMIERGSTITRADILAVLEERQAAIASLLLEGFNVNTPEVNYRIGLKGVFTSQTDSFDPSRHNLEASLNPGSYLRQAIRERAQVQKQEAIKPRPNPVEYLDANTNERNSALTPGGMGCLSGHRLKFNPDDPDQGIFLTQLNNGNTPIRVEVVGKNTPAELLFMVPAGLSAGDYSLTVQAVFGQDSARAGLLEATLTVA
jgi:hypothetical protein